VAGPWGEFALLVGGVLPCFSPLRVTLPKGADRTARVTAINSQSLVNREVGRTLDSVLPTFTI